MTSSRNWKRCSRGCSASDKRRLMRCTRSTRSRVRRAAADRLASGRRRHRAGVARRAAHPESAGVGAGRALVAGGTEAVLALMPVPALSIPLLPAEIAPRSRGPRISIVGSRPDAIDRDCSPRRRHAIATSTGSAVARSDWSCAWFGGLAALAVRLLLRCDTLARVVRRSAPCAVGRRRHCRRARRRARTDGGPPGSRVERDRLAAARWSAAPARAASPGRAAFTPNERAMALGHELMHVRRHDLALGWVPALAERPVLLSSAGASRGARVRHGARGGLRRRGRARARRRAAGLRTPARAHSAWPARCRHSLRAARRRRSRP